VTDSGALVRCEHVAHTYGSGRAAVVALHGLSCEIGAGEQIAMMGPSGSGKSTLLHLIAGLETPTAGSVTWPALGDRASLSPRTLRCRSFSVVSRRRKQPRAPVKRLPVSTWAA
jgi:ABC-type lipoprotein export system ATPase subunit